MERLTENKIILIRSKTRLDNLITRYNTASQAKFYLEHLGADFSDYVQEHNLYNEVISQAEKILSSFGRIQIVEREFLPNFIFGKNDLVIAIGRDGLVANTLKYLDHQPLIGINPDPDRWDGVLLPFTINDLKTVIPSVFEKTCEIQEITIAKAELNDGQILYGVNDLFIGQKTHISARYRLEQNGNAEPQSSSGIIVSTGLGSTGWYKSIVTGAMAVSRGTRKRAPIQKGKKKGGEKILEKPLSQIDTGFKWNSDYLYYSVREPFPSRSSGVEMAYGKITPTSPLNILSQMPENGVIFSDGIENDNLVFNSGFSVKIGLAEKKGRLVV